MLIRRAYWDQLMQNWEARTLLLSISRCQGVVKVKAKT